MPSGLQMWDAAGNLILDYTTRAGLILGSFVVGLGNQSGSFTDASLPDGDVWSVAIMAPAGGDPGDAPSVTKSGTTLQWTRFHPSRAWQGTIFYGVR